MTIAATLPLGILAVAILVPIAREYSGLRSELGLGRAGALLASSLLVPAFGLALALSLPLADVPALQWTVLVVATLVLYSASVAALRPALASAASRRSS